VARKPKFPEGETNEGTAQMLERIARMWPQIQQLENAAI
jgi:hypothetical protein